MTADEIEATRPRFEECRGGQSFTLLTERNWRGDYKCEYTKMCWLVWKTALRGVPSPAEVAGGKGEGE